MTILEQLKSLIGVPMAEYSRSPTGVWLNGVLQQVESDCIKATYTVRPEMANPAGILHGGMASTILDDIMGLTVYSLEREAFFATVSLNVEFLANVQVGETVTATAEVVKSGRSVVFMQASLHNEEGKLLVKASSNLVAAAQYVARP